MRIYSSPSSGIVNQPTSDELAGESRLANALLTPAGGGQAGVQFGQPAANPPGMPAGVEQTAPSILAFLFKGSDESTPATAGPQVQPQPSSDTLAQVASTAPTAPVALAAAPESTDASAPVALAAAPESTDASDPANAPKAADAAFLDDSEYSSPEALKCWDSMVQNLPPEQRLQAEKELNRPIAAAWMAREDGPNAAKAMDFINDNPALKTAVDVGDSGGHADGKITNKDLESFAKYMQEAAGDADKSVSDYMSAHPDADPQSLEMVRSAALMQANMPLATAADPKKALGAQDQAEVDGSVGAGDLNGLAQGNPGLSGILKQSCNTWAQPGFLGQLDEAGLSGNDKAKHSPDQLFDKYNVDSWIRNQAPTNGGQFASMLSDAATLNSVAGIDTSKLNSDVFEHPEAYSGAEKAAVMIKLQQVLQSIIAGRKLRDTEETERQLNEKISQLQADTDVQGFLNNSVPEQERALVRSNPVLHKAVVKQAKHVNSGDALRDDMQTADKAVNDKNPNADYSGAIGGLSAQLQMQKDLFPDADVPTVDQVLGKRPELQSAIQDSYVRNFSKGGALKQLLDQKKADAGESLQTADNQKAIYDSVLSSDFTQSQQSDYLDSTVTQLQNSKSGRELLEGKNDDNPGPSIVSQVASEFGPRALQSAMGFASVSDMLKQGNKLGAAQTIYDSTTMGAEAVKGGIDAGAKMMGREASAGLGRMAGQIAGRAIGMVAGEATGLVAGAALGAAVPVIGWAIDGAMALGFGISAIVEAVKKHKAQKEFDHTVDPVLDQFGIVKAH